MTPDYYPTPIKVLHSVIRFPPAIGGVEKYVSDIVNTRVLNEAVSEVLTSDLDSINLGTHLDPSVREPNVTRLKAHQVAHTYRYPVLSGYFRKGGDLARVADVVHGHSIYYPSYDGAIVLAARHKKALVLSPYFYPRERRIWKAYLLASRHLLARRAEIVVAVSIFERDLLRKFDIVPDACPIKVVYPLVRGLGTGDPKARAPMPSAAQVNACFIGRVSKYKGAADLAPIVRACHKRGIPLRLYVAGPDDGGLSDLVDAAARLAITGSVEVLGPVSDIQKQELLAKCHFLFLPSYYEAFGIVIAEAAVAGVVPIAYESGAVSEVIQLCGAGRAVPPGEVDAFADSVMELIGQAPETSKGLREAGLEKKLGLERWRAAWSQVYAECLTR